MNGRTRVFAMVAALGLFGVVEPTAQSVSVDNSYYDWQEMPALAAFTRYFNPYYFSRETREGRDQLRIERSLYWGQGGTRLREIKGVVTDEGLYFYIGAETNFAPELSIYAYIYPERRPDRTNRYTLELLPARTEEGGFVALWAAGEPPREVGILRNASFTLECLVPWNELPESLTGEGLDELSIDITTCFFEPASGTYEEFYFTTLYLKDMMRAGEES